MNILMLGHGRGSWVIRGAQLGEAIGARVRPHLGGAPLDREELAWADVAVLVKRAALPCAPQLREYEIPIVWDALDFWAQPGDHGLSAAEALDRVARTCDYVRPAAIVGATAAMAQACSQLLPAFYLPHHSWDGLRPTEPRRRVEAVAYEGNPAYLGAWHAALLKACQRRGWTFLVNPSDLRSVDILVAVRDGAWDGWICREWKSGVKVVNAIAAGRPLLSQDTAAVREIGPCGTVLESLAGLDAALDAWTDEDARLRAMKRDADLAPTYRLDAVAQRYAAALATVVAQQRD